jgi:UDP-N-acetylglucosamine 4,6-dehydratase/5-epimerase
MFKNKTLLITGGTGSFGNAVLNHFLKSDIKEIKIFSRDEKKQDDMRRLYKSKKIKFFIGDVRDPLSIDGAMANTDYVFHAAALKQVPSCEFFPVEAVKTNIIGTENVLNSAINNKVEKIICLSTDKAVYPINAMGISKAMMEKVFLAKSRNSGKTKIIGTRYGNVMGSRGSVIPLFIEQIKAGKPITITDPKMTRFMMTLDEAVELVLYAFKNGNQGDLFVQKSPAATVSVLAKAMAELYKSKSPVKEIGIRHGEKMYETLVTKEEMIKAEDQEKYFKITPDGRDLNYDQYFSKGTVKPSIDEYNSNNTNLLNVEEMKNLLMTLPQIKEEINN